MTTRSCRAETSHHANGTAFNPFRIPFVLALQARLAAGANAHHGSSHSGSDVD